MLQRYRAVFRAPGSLAFCLASFVMRMPIAIYPIGIVLIISARDGHYGFAGVLSACYVLGGALGMPLTAVLVDRYGQRRVLLPAAVVHASAVVTLAVLIRTPAPHAALVAPTIVIGFSYLSVGSLVRARWAHVWRGRAELATALSFESVLDELIFVVGPLIATLLATQTVPDVVLYLALGLVAGGSVWLAALRVTDPPVHAVGDEGHVFAMRERGMLLLTITTVPMGAVFASAEVTAVAYCSQHGHRGWSGLALAAMAGGSAISGLIYGARDRPGSRLSRFRRQALVFAVLPVVLLGVFNISLLALAMLVVGFGIAPTLITAFALVQQLVPARSLTEGLTWVNTGLSVGYGVGAALVGNIADEHGARTAFLVVIGAAVVVGVLALALHARLRVRGAAEPSTVA